MTNMHGQAVIDDGQRAVGTIATAVGEIEADQADLCAFDQARRRRVALARKRLDPEGRRIG